MYDKRDLIQFESKSISVQTIDNQIANFKKGFPYAQLVKPAVIGDGILSLTGHEIEELVDYYDKNSPTLDIVKFVPASGAASRMFKALYEFNEKAGTVKEEELLHQDKTFHSVHNYFKNIENFAFFSDLKKALKDNGHDHDNLVENKKYSTHVDHLLNEHGLGYGTLPKGLLKFHKYPEGNRVAMEEHLAEGADYCRTHDGKVKIHFTVSPEHLDRFKARINEVAEIYEQRHNIHLDISFSVQKPSTDTIAVDMNNIPFRDDDGSILFRPGGHGALIENLNDIDADIVFIKNIDNVVPDRLKSETVRYKKTIGGLLIKLQKQIHEYLHLLQEENVDADLLGKIRAFAREKANIRFPDDFDGLTSDKKKLLLKQQLNRPVRICGMVKNEGEPGGGPFWVKNSKGEVSLQIVESSQVDMKNEEQRAILEKSTHFNPVDLVCGIRDYKGNHFELGKFIDPETGFISTKSKGGKNLKAQELPGLWNGAMADWITLFVEVPIITFNPVKTVNDLLRDQHQPG